jgi:hypothetical protein
VREAGGVLHEDEGYGHRSTALNLSPPGAATTAPPGAAP